ncbi:hypothetical protein BJ875DRAFT_452774 [Amylocarpus encephaloides]|uniref:ABC transmembrane type-1 domain-containing protein n=1 Tax=Amylocarpus encephaloides TaxID=45428 RepID=A0A9P8C8I0_9HELO|nr:hypothetical protein BJ875DRAFT_452774 [Amylocarpus encephaloides]
MRTVLGFCMTGSLKLGENVIFGHLVELPNCIVPPGLVNFFCLTFFALSLVALLGHVISGSCFGIVSEHAILKTRDISFQTILQQDTEWFLQPARSTSALVSIGMASGHLNGLSGVIISTIVFALVTAIGGAILAHIVAWKIAIMLFATSPLVVVVGYARLRVLVNWWRRINWPTRKLRRQQ